MTSIWQRMGERHVDCQDWWPLLQVGMGGGAASSRVLDAKDADLDFDAVQRGDQKWVTR